MVYLIQADLQSPMNRIEGIDSFIVIANSEDEARALCKGALDGDSDSIWDDATVTEVTPGSVLGWTFRLQISDDVADVSITVTDPDWDIADALHQGLGPQLALLGLVGESFADGTWTISNDTDAIGDKTIALTITPPSNLFKPDYDFDSSVVVDELVHEGSSEDPLQVVLVSDPILPVRVTSFGRRR